MNLPRLSRFPSLSLPKALLCAVAAALAGCGDRVAGTSVGTGNPTEIAISFRDEAGAVVPVTGSIHVYAATQIPTFASAPLFSVDVNAATSGSIGTQALAGVADSLWAEGSTEGASRKFNLVVQGQDQGVILKGFTWRKDEGRFGLRSEDGDAIRNGNRATIKGGLTPLVTLSGSVDTLDFYSKWDYHLFVYGTGFTSKIENGRFSLVNIPRGEYTSHMILLPNPEGGASGVDTASIFGFTGLAGQAGTLAVGPLHNRVALPDSLQVK